STLFAQFPFRRPPPAWCAGRIQLALFSHCFFPSFQSLCIAPEVRLRVFRDNMRLLLPILLFAASASGQWIAPTAGELLLPSQSLEQSTTLSSALPEDGAQRILTFKDSDIKFSLGNLMEI